MAGAGVCAGGRMKGTVDDFNDRQVKSMAHPDNAASVNPSDRYGPR
jgi:hypothetical protein